MTGSGPQDGGMFESTLIPVNGVRLEVFEAGRAGRPVVLCHGWPEHAFSWRHQVPALAAAGYHVIVPNQRGYGGSSRPTETWSRSWTTTDTGTPPSSATTGARWWCGAWPCCIRSG
ncbi:hypothetical protein GCM10009557_86600 [Virgisporangium ochraceum]